MTKLSILQIETFIQKMKKDMKILLNDRCDLWNEGRRCDYEMEYNEEKQIYVLTTNCYASKNDEPETSYLDFDEKQAVEYFLSLNRDKFYFWIARTPKIIEKQVQQFLDDLQKNAKTSTSIDLVGDPWNGYPSQGFVITYQATENNYFWENWFDDGFYKTTTDTNTYTFEEVKETLKKVLQEHYL